ncbi:gliding motility lipoprotein GldH [Mangrovibacterium lignilyticum]|uniref:gliding motility lipoprotein GldH n=1 Tax=Mangrovibacterium lignilyticum TaxID=2668052 RepID=UPI0013D69C98|nr:gliding motility lipoprotein GldH [Mangrovibacterium lignilyticum]
MKFKFWLIIVLFFAVLLACDRQKEFEAYQSLDTSGWNKDSLVVFTVEFEDTLSSHNLYLNVRNSGDYQFSNLWLFVHIKSPDGTLLTDTLEFQLADPSGKWTGSGIGDLFDNQFTYKDNIYFPLPGKYEFSIQQGMRSETLKGIRDIGIRIEKRD